MTDDLYERAVRRAGENGRPKRPPIDPALAQSRADIARLASEARVKARTLDPGLSQALDRLAALETEAVKTRGNLAALSERARAGEIAPDAAARLRATVRQEAERELLARYEAARKEADAARERALAAFLPPVEADGGRTLETKSDLALALDAGGKDASSAFRNAWMTALRDRNRVGLALLSGSWGRNQWVARGGDASQFDDLRRGLLRDVAEGPAFADVEAIKTLRALNSRVVTEAVVGTREHVRIAVDALAEDE